MKKVIYIFLVLLAVSTTIQAAYASQDRLMPKKQEWSFDGVFGKFDRQAIQRGFKVYKEVCAACHSLKRVAFRNLKDVGFSEEEIKALAASYTIVDGPNDDGEMYERPGRPSDRFPGPYTNDKAARAANNGALPPDFSLLIKAREDGANYVHSLLTGYEPAPEGFVVGEGLYYNPYFMGGGMKLAMTPPLTADGQVEYPDGTKPTIDQMARDVVNFMQWAAEPEMEERKGLGVSALIFTAILTIFFFIAKRIVWRGVR